MTEQTDKPAFAGRAEIHLSQADLKEALQFWLAEKVLKAPAPVEAVKANEQAGVLHVIVEIGDA